MAIIKFNVPAPTLHESLPRVSLFFHGALIGLNIGLAVCTVIATVRAFDILYSRIASLDLDITKALSIESFASQLEPVMRSTADTISSYSFNNVTKKINN